MEATIKNNKMHSVIRIKSHSGGNHESREIKGTTERHNFEA
jgi:hypothetical protein